VTSEEEREKDGAREVRNEKSMINIELFKMEVPLSFEGWPIGIDTLKSQVRP
jgi:hypothetical protein